MANIKSQVKRIKTNQKQREHNRSLTSEMKTAFKKAELAIKAAGEESTIKELISQAYQLIDQLVNKGILPKNTAANKKSKLMLKFNKIQTKASEVKKD